MFVTFVTSSAQPKMPYCCIDLETTEIDLNYFRFGSCGKLTDN